MDPVLRKFDYGEELNFFHYGTTRPPGYDLGLAKLPMAMFYGDSDLQSSDDDIDLAISRMVNVRSIRRYKIKNFGHASFSIGKKMDQVMPRIQKEIGPASSENEGSELERAEFSIDLSDD